MKLLTKAIENKLAKHPLYSTDGKGDNAEVLVKFFSPEGAATWLVTEAEKQPDGDWLFYGKACLFYGEWEWGYFTLSDLAAIRTPRFHLPIERDLYSSGTVAELAA